MSRRTGDEHDGGDGQRRLTRLLSMPQLAGVVPHVAPDVLHQLVRRVGLDQSVDLVEAATREQLTAILDLDLWGASLPGRDASFDADRFGEWVEVLVDHDVASAGRVVTRLDRSLVAMGLSRYVRVFDPGALAPAASTDDESWDNGLRAADHPTGDVGGYVVEARRTDAWDAVIRLLVELMAEHAECFHAVMRECLRLSDAGREPDGLDDLLEPGEQRLHDVTVAREDRRTGLGFTTPAEARAFVAMARRGRSTARHRNPVALAYFRRAEAVSSDTADHTRGTRASPHRSDAPPAPVDPAVADALDEFGRVLAGEGLLTDGPITDGPRALLGGSDGDRSEPGALESLLEYLRDWHPDVCLTRGRELAFLANTLVAGCSLQSRSFTPREASAAVVATCGLGLLQEPAPPGVDYLVDHDLIATFEEGWAALHREVSLFVAEGLLGVLRDVSLGHSDTLAGLRALRRSLATHLESGTPWLALEALDVLSTLDTPAWLGLLGLLGECPVIPAVVTAIVERRTGRIDPHGFEFIATTAQIDTIRAFVARLPGLLAG